MKSAEDQERISATKAAEPLPVQGRGLRFTYPTGARPLDGYTVKRGIGIGGFGEVYFAVSDAGKEVALKRIQRNVDVELRGVSQCLNLKHSNLITLWDIKQDEHGEGWVVMEYVPGRNLRDAINDHPNGMELEKALQWFSGIAAGVDYLHDHGIVHRDLKPGNIFIDEDEGLVKIGDYGLSKFISCSRREGQTESVGTFHYMAPEIGKGVYGKEIDIYALGIILCEMLTGNVPFDGESSQEIIMKHLTADPYLGKLQEPYNSVIRRALAKSPERRFSSTREMIEMMSLPPNGTENVSSPLSRWGTSGHPGSDNPSSAGESNNKSPLFIGHDEDGAGIMLGELREVVYAEVVDESAPSSQAGYASHHSQAGVRSSQHPTQQHSTQQHPSQHRQPSGYPRPTSSNSGVASTHPNAGHREPVSTVAQGNSQVGQAVNAQRAQGLLSLEDEPIARSVRGGWVGIVRGWQNSKLSTFVKIVILVLLGVVLYSNKDILIPVCIGLAIAYVCYFSVLVFIRWRSRRDKPLLVIADSNESAPKVAMDAEDQILRRRLDQRGTPMRVMELTGSMLMASLIVGAIGLVAMAIHFRSLAFSMESMTFFVWLTLTGSLSTWAILMLGRVWEGVREDALRRRLIMLASGLLLGGLSFGVADMLMLDMELTNTITLLASESSSIASHPNLGAFMIYFGGLFVIMRWWRQADPLRQVRINVLTIGLCLLWAFAFNLVCQFPLPWGILLGGTISFAVQVSSKFFDQDDRQLLLDQPDRILL